MADNESQEPDADQQAALAKEMPMLDGRNATFECFRDSGGRLLYFLNRKLLQDDEIPTGVRSMLVSKPMVDTRLAKYTYLIPTVNGDLLVYRCDVYSFHHDFQVPLQVLSKLRRRVPGLLMHTTVVEAGGDVSGEDRTAGCEIGTANGTVPSE